jgi:hypothetical protein
MPLNKNWKVKAVKVQSFMYPEVKVHNRELITYLLTALKNVTVFTSVK